LTTQTYEELASSIHGLAHELTGGKLLLLGGGGYNPENVARCWSIIFSTVAGGVPGDKLEAYASLHDVEMRNPSMEVGKRVKNEVGRLRENLVAIHGDIFQGG
jgi:acetoin utilization protein AcuC